jgi:hypothetical protein
MGLREAKKASVHKMMRFWVVVQGGGSRCGAELSETKDVVPLRQIGSQPGREVVVTTVVPAQTTLQPQFPARRVGMPVSGHLAKTHPIHSGQHQTPVQQSTNRSSLATWCPPRKPYIRAVPVQSEPGLQLTTSYRLATGARRETVYARRLARPHAPQPHNRLVAVPSHLRVPPSTSHRRAPGARRETVYARLLARPHAHQRQAVHERLPSRPSVTVHATPSPHPGSAKSKTPAPTRNRHSAPALTNLRPSDPSLRVGMTGEEEQANHPSGMPTPPASGTPTPQHRYHAQDKLDRSNLSHAAATNPRCVLNRKPFQAHRPGRSKQRPYEDPIRQILSAVPARRSFALTARCTSRPARLSRDAFAARAFASLRDDGQGPTQSTQHRLDRRRPAHLWEPAPHNGRGIAPRRLPSAAA